MIVRKFTPFLVLLLCMLSGCVYFRLQRLKEQLAQFDSYFKVDQSSGLKLECLEPVLYSQDIIWMGLIPTQRNCNGAEQRWIYVLQKLYPQDKKEPANYDITYELGFTDNKLSQMFFPDRFLSVVPSPFVIEVFQAIGKADIDRSHRTLTGKTHKEETAAPVEAPTRHDVLRNLGAPFSTGKQDQKEQWRYQYSARISESENTVDTILFTFDTTSDKLSTVVVRHLKSTFSFDF